MTDSPVAALRAQFEAIARKLDHVGAAGAEREAVRREIIAFFKQVDGLIAELGSLKEDIRQLVEKYKQVAASTQEAAAPEFTGTRPAVHADHIGASTYIEKGWSLISLGDHAGAIQALKKALQLSPGETQAESLLGWAQMLHEDYDDALQTFQKVLMKEPANSLARINVGYICLKKRIFGEAIEHLSKAIRLDNDKKATLYAHFYLGLVYLQREMFEDAQTFFQKTLKLGPNLIEAYFELGRAYWFAGDQDTAKRTWDEGFKANKFNPWGKTWWPKAASRCAHEPAKCLTSLELRNKLLPLCPTRHSRARASVSAPGTTHCSAPPSAVSSWGTGCCRAARRRRHRSCWYWGTAFSFRSASPSSRTMDHGRIAQRFRAPALHAGSRGFESLFAHWGTNSQRR